MSLICEPTCMLVVLGEGVVEFVNLWWVCTKHFRATYVMREVWFWYILTLLRHKNGMLWQEICRRPHHPTALHPRLPTSRNTPTQTRQRPRRPISDGFRFRSPSMQGRPPDHIRGPPSGRPSPGRLRVPAVVLVGFRSPAADEGLQIAVEAEGGGRKPQLRCILERQWSRPVCDFAPVGSRGLCG